MSEPRVPRRMAQEGPAVDSSTSEVPLGQELVGRRIGDKYQVGAVLGAGGVGTVYEALSLAVGRPVAIKVLHHGRLHKRDAVRRFHQEARAAGAIGHPNICEIYDAGTLENGCPYIVMERLVGETMADRIANEGGLPLEQVINIVTQVLSGLVAAHEKGIVHRDVKPENVFLARRVGCAPMVKLLDFGASKMIGMWGPKDPHAPELTRVGIVVGTPYYLAPEQASGERKLDARVDLYACGVLLYEALTAQVPFTGPNHTRLLFNIMKGMRRPARELRPDLPLAVDRILDKAMARDREDRYQTASAFQADLQHLAARRAGSADTDLPSLEVTALDTLTVEVPVDFRAAGGDAGSRASLPSLVEEDQSETNIMTALVKEELIELSRRPSRGKRRR